MSTVPAPAQWDNVTTLLGRTLACAQHFQQLSLLDGDPGSAVHVPPRGLKLLQFETMVAQYVCGMSKCSKSMSWTPWKGF
jgi:hypothetical protein